MIDELPVRSPLDLRHKDLHDLAHVLLAGGPNLRDALARDLLNRSLIQLLRLILPEQLDLALLLFREVHPPALCELLHRIQPLLDRFSNDDGHVAVGRLLARIHSGVLDLGKYGAQGGELLILTSFHHGLDVGLYVLEYLGWHGVPSVG